MFIFLSLLTLLIIPMKVKPEFTPVVQTDKGFVRGHILYTVENDTPYAAFEGMPFAKPPLGNLRFKPPVEPEPWSGIFDATSASNLCMQPSIMNSSVFGSEDCLYINVYTPQARFSDFSSKAVLLFIHGGGFTNGNSHASYYGPDYLIQEDIILVTFNYRLGAFGFLNLNHENAAGNCGLKDQNLAMKWVQNNIAAFGGDPSKVTILGQSAGSVSVDLHVLSDASVGLFSQSICMSGSSLNVYWGFQSAEDAKRQAYKLGSLLGVKTKNKNVLLNALLKARAFDVIEKTNDLFKMSFRPTVESTLVAKDQIKIVKKCTIAKYLSGNYAKGPHVVGFTSHETMLYIQPIQSLIEITASGIEWVKKASSSLHIPILSDVMTAMANAASRLLDTSVQRLVEESSNLFFSTGIDARQRLLELHNVHPIYYYRFSFNPEHSLHKYSEINVTGVAHADDLPYIFYMPMLKIPPGQPDIVITRRRMVRLFANFVKYGNPTPGGKKDELLKITWPDSRFTGTHLEIGSNLTIGPRPIGSSTKYMQKVGLGTSSVLDECSKKVLSRIKRLYDKS